MASNSRNTGDVTETKSIGNAIALADASTSLRLTQLTGINSDSSSCSSSSSSSSSSNILNNNNNNNNTNTTTP